MMDKYVYQMWYIWVNKVNGPLRVENANLARKVSVYLVQLLCR